MASSATAAPTLTSLYPAGGQRGTTVEVVASGTFDAWPVQVWTSSPDISAKAGKDKGKLSITMKPETKPGVYWLRLHDNSGASALRPFLVGTFPDVAEVEPNDEPAKAQVVAAPCCVHGKLIKSGDVDCFAVKVKKGETLVASLDANFTQRSPIDAVLQIVSADSTVLAENHDTRGLDPQATYAATADATLYVRVFAFPAMPDSSIRHFGSELSVYRLTLSTGPHVDYATPFAATADKPLTLQLHGWNLKEKTHELKADLPSLNEYPSPIPLLREPHPCWDFTTAKPKEALTPPFSLTSRLNEREFAFEFRATKGQALSLKLESASLGFSLNPVVTISGPDGKQVGRHEPAKLNADLDVAFTPAAEGNFKLTVRDLAQASGSRYAFRLKLTSAPEITATVTADRFTLVPGTPLLIPVTVNKVRLTDELDFAVEGLPPEITAKLNKVDAKVLTIQLDSKLMTFSGGFRVRLFSKKDPKLSCFSTATLAEFEMSTPDLWLTIAGKK